MILKSKLIFVVLMLCFVFEARGQSIVAPLGKEVALAGEIRKVHDYGPPGYGEDKGRDARISYWILELPHPIKVPCIPERGELTSEDCQATKQLRLFFPTSPANNGLDSKAKAMRGHRAIVNGILHRSDTVGESTPIYMDVTDIQPTHAPPQNP